MAASSTDSLLLGQPWHQSAHRVAKAPGPLRPAGLEPTPSAPLSSLNPKPVFSLNACSPPCPVDTTTQRGPFCGEESWPF